MIAKIQQGIFLLRRKYLPMWISLLRVTYYRLQGMRVGNKTTIPAINVTWPHQLQIGNDCKIENNVSFKFDGIWSPGPSIIIGNDVFIGANCEFNIDHGIHIKDNSLIASGCKFIDHDHGVTIGTNMRCQQSVGARIVIEEDVWLGVNVVVLKGVTIGAGAIVAAGAIVNKSIPENQIWGGIPAKFIKVRS
jgi:acetyltransferase-like isoleucine patch superfamily enzyme